METLLIALTFGSVLLAAAFAAATWHLLRENRMRSAARVAALADAIDGTGGSAMFSQSPISDIRERPVIRFAIAGIMLLVLGGYAVAQLGSSDDAPPQAATANAEPLELLSMRHAREKSTMTVTGLVRNPARGAELERVHVVVLAFDRQGSFVTSNRVPIDFVSLSPGDESPFTVLLSNASAISRYRVTFRTDSGIVRHLDLRDGSAALASRQQLQ